MGVVKTIPLSANSRKLFDEYLRLTALDNAVSNADISSIDFIQCIDLLTNDEPLGFTIQKDEKKKARFILASLQAELLKDFNRSLPGKTIVKKKEKVKGNFYNKAKFFVIATSGTLLSICEGFDSIATILMPLSLSPIYVLLLGLGFSLLSVVVFFGFDMVQVADNLGIEFTDAPKCADIYLAQLEEIKILRKKIQNYCLTERTQDELNQLNHTLLMLQARLEALAKDGQKLQKALQKTKLKICKGIIGFFAGVLFFGSGYFAGQSVAIYLLGLAISSVSATCFPVVAFSLLFGVSAFLLYWYMQQVGVSSLVSTWFGLDEEKIEKICDESDLEKQFQLLENLQQNVVSTREWISNEPPLPHALYEGEGTVIAPVKHRNKIGITFFQLNASNQETLAAEEGSMLKTCFL